MKKLIALMLALVMLVSLVACGKTPEAPVVEDPTDPPATAPQATEPAATEPPANANPVYTVKIVDEAGNPVVGVMVQICQGETCLPGPVSDANGVVTFQVAEADYKVSFLGGVPAGYEYTTEETEFYFENGSYEVTIVLKAVA